MDVSLRKYAYILFLFFQLCHLIPPSHSDSTRAKLDPYDLRILRKIQKHFGGPSSGFWNSSDPYCCVYCSEPVSCNADGHLNSLTLTSSPTLYGKIPSIIGNLTSLTYLSIIGKGFRGRIPTSFGNLTNLGSLTIKDTNITGLIPSSLGQLTNLWELIISSNMVLGPIPTSLSNLSRVGELNLGSNRLSGRIPESLGQMTNLGTLNLSSNKLFGSIPNSLGQIQYLGFLDLSYNNLSGTIPDLSKSWSLEQLILHSNNLSGPIPAFIGNLAFMRSISLHSNKFSGQIPESSWYNNDEYYLDLSNNELTGHVPRSLSISPLLSLDLSGNKLTDASNLFNRDTQGYCYRLDLSNNLLKFDFSHASFPPGQNFLNISHNMIYGSFPRLLAEMPEGSTLDVSYNELCGPIPRSPVLEMMDATNFEHNACLCGAPLPPCDYPVPPYDAPSPSPMF